MIQGYTGGRVREGIASLRLNAPSLVTSPDAGLVYATPVTRITPNTGSAPKDMLPDNLRHVVVTDLDVINAMR